MTKKISDMSAASTLDGTELFEAVQGGTSKKATAAQIRAASIPVTALDTDTALTADSDTKVASQKAVKAYVDANATAYVDITLDPVTLITAPYYDPSHSGPGLIAVPAPAADEAIFPVAAQVRTTAGDIWDADTAMRLNWGVTSSETTAVRADISCFGQGMSDYLPDDASIPYDVFYGLDNTAVVAIDPTCWLTHIIGQPLSLHSRIDITAGGTVFGTKSVLLRLWYQIKKFPPSGVAASTYFRITALVQVAKTFTVTDANADLSGATGTFTVVGSTGNNGTYTIVSAISGAGDTVITVVEAIPNATADGWVKQ